MGALIPTKEIRQPMQGNEPKNALSTYLSKRTHIPTTSGRFDQVHTPQYQYLFPFSPHRGNRFGKVSRRQSSPLASMKPGLTFLKLVPELFKQKSSKQVYVGVGLLVLTCGQDNKQGILNETIPFCDPTIEDPGWETTSTKFQLLTKKYLCYSLNYKNLTVSIETYMSHDQLPIRRVRQFQSSTCTCVSVVTVCYMGRP